MTNHIAQRSIFDLSLSISCMEMVSGRLHVHTVETLTHRKIYLQVSCERFSMHTIFLDVLSVHSWLHTSYRMQRVGCHVGHREHVFRRLPYILATMQYKSVCKKHHMCREQVGRLKMAGSRHSRRRALCPCSHPHSLLRQSRVHNTCPHHNLHAYMHK